MRQGTPTAGEIESWIRQKVAEAVNLDPANVGSDNSFDQFGIDSAKSISLVIDLEHWLELEDELPLDILFEGTSIRDSAERIFALTQGWSRKSDLVARV